MKCSNYRQEKWRKVEDQEQFTRMNQLVIWDNPQHVQIAVGEKEGGDAPTGKFHSIQQRVIRLLCCKDIPLDECFAGPQVHRPSQSGDLWMDNEFFCFCTHRTRPPHFPCLRPLSTALFTTVSFILTCRKTSLFVTPYRKKEIIRLYIRTGCSNSRQRDKWSWAIQMKRPNITEKWKQWEMSIFKKMNNLT